MSVCIYIYTPIVTIGHVYFLKLSLSLVQFAMVLAITSLLTYSMCLYVHVVYFIK